MNAPVTLDRLAAQWGQKIVDRAGAAVDRDKTAMERIESLVRSASSVFERHGVAAGFLFLLSRTSEQEGPMAARVAEELVELICQLDPSLQRPKTMKGQPLLSFLAGEVTDQLPRMLQTHRVLCQALVFARLAASAALLADEAPPPASGGPG